MTGARDEDTYYGFVNIDTVSTYLLLGELNYPEVAAADAGNSYLHGFTKEKIYTVSGTDFGE